MKKETEVVDYDSGYEDRKLAMENRADSKKYDENYWLKNRLDWVVNLYYELDKCILGFRPQIRKEFLVTYIKYSCKNTLLCYIVIGTKSQSLKMWVKLAYEELTTTPLFIRDYSSAMHRPGVMISFNSKREFEENKEAMLQVVCGILKKAVAKLGNKKRRNLRTPLVVKTNPVPEQISKITSVNLDVGENGFVEILIKVQRDQLNKTLDRILQ